MDLKSFVVGAVCGGLIYAGASSLLTDQSPSTSVESIADRTAQPPPLVQPATVDQDSDSPLSEPEARITTGRSDTESESTPVETTTPITTNPQVSSQSNGGASSASQNSSDQRGSTGQERSWFANRRADLMAEPKDEAWAYFMEQSILQFLSNHSAMPEFSLEYIECRTTACQIGVAGYDESTGPTWQRVMYDMRQQPWYEFGPVGSSSGEVGGRHMTITELDKLPSD